MNTCACCRRHVLASDTTCPFCHAQGRRAPTSFGQKLAIVATPIVLAACYGGPTGFDSGATFDLDDDGFTTATDCNDDDAAIHPDATEVCDGVDNNCDSAVDEGCADDTGTDDTGGE